MRRRKYRGEKIEVEARKGEKKEIKRKENTRKGNKGCEKGTERKEN